MDDVQGTVKKLNIFMFLNSLLSTGIESGCRQLDERRRDTSPVL